LFLAERRDRTNLTVAFHNLRTQLTTGSNAAVKIDKHKIKYSKKHTHEVSYIYYIYIIYIIYIQSVPGGNIKLTCE